ncbi:hypothetical protein Droror1_Dr00017275 [Drosera rotundifolia]
MASSPTNLKPLLFLSLTMANNPNPKTLESLVSTMHHLSTNLIIDVDSPWIKTFLDLDHNNNSSPLIAADPVLSTLVAHLRTLMETLKGLQDYSFGSFVRRWLLNFEIAAVAGEILGNVKGSLDREMMERVVSVLREAGNDEGKMRVLGWFYKRVCKGFDMGLQDLVLRMRVFELLESVVCDGECVLVREKAAMAIAALAGFNKVVFVGLVLMGHTVKGLVSMGTSCSLRVLGSLIRLIRGHLVDEIDLSGDIPKIIGYLGSEDESVPAMALDCLLEMTFYGRCETVEMMVECGLIEKLVFLQRQETCEKGEGQEVNEDVDEEDVFEDHPFVGCVARFALQVEMGKGMESDGKSRIKTEILWRAREASVSEAEAATLVAALLWGSFS